ncbi:hypothetical protein [Pseudoduganella sp. HUAS MS19]
MNDVEPQFRCVGCNRGVLNRSVARCLYCGVDLPAEARLSPEQIAQRNAEHARMEEARRRLAQPAPPSSQAGGSQVSSIAEGVSAGIDVIDLIGDGISAIGKLLD